MAGLRASYVLSMLDALRGLHGQLCPSLGDQILDSYFIGTKCVHVAL